MMKHNATWFGQPRGLTILFFTEMWEKFSFYGMRALQIYYMTKELNYTQAHASFIFGAYAAGVYLTPIFGGMIADRWLGRRRAVVIGGLLMAVGHFMMSAESLFFPAMAVIAAGNGLFLPNLPSQVPLLYPKGDPRGIAAFNVYYMGVNLGGFLAPLICGTLGELYGWHYGFGAAGIGMCLGLFVYIAGGRYLPPDQRDAAPVGVPDQKSDGINDTRADTRAKVLLLLSVAFAVMLFRSAHEQSGNTLALWADTSVDRAIFGTLIPVTWFQSLNPMFVFMISPMLLAMLSRRAAQGRATPPPLRSMAMGAFGVGLSYCMLALVILFSAPGHTHWIWLVLFFALYTLGELYILPVGLGLFATLAPRQFGATTIAAWFLTSFAGNLLSGVIGAGWELTSPQLFFAAMGGICFGACGLLLAINRVHRRHAAAAAPVSTRENHASGEKRSTG
jgi:POT family proton-dependent oligopeptide transporter